MLDEDIASCGVHTCIISLCKIERGIYIHILLTSVRGVAEHHWHINNPETLVLEFFQIIGFRISYRLGCHKIFLNDWGLKLNNS